MCEHTPTPWRVYKNTDGTKLVGIGGADGVGILDAGFGVWAWNDPEGIANAEKVVRAVNAHDDLVQSLQAAQGQIMNAKIDLQTGHTKAAALKTLDGIIKFIDAALAKVQP